MLNKDQKGNLIKIGYVKTLEYFDNCAKPKIDVPIKQPTSKQDLHEQLSGILKLIQNGEIEDAKTSIEGLINE
jgi:hypothetical protein